MTLTGGDLLNPPRCSGHLDSGLKTAPSWSPVRADHLLLTCFPMLCVSGRGARAKGGDLSN